MVEVICVSKRFKTLKRNAVEEVTFTAIPGRITGILGANGSGKTTLLRLISGLLVPDSGIIRVCGTDVVNELSLAKKHLGVLFGADISLYGRLTAFENILFFSQLQGLDSSIAKLRISEISQLFGMDQYLYRRVSTFSRGMKQKVAFACMMIHEPDIIVLDEPSTGLDIYSVRDVDNFILECKRRNKTILISTHNVHEIESLCDDIIILRDGHIIANGTKSEIMQMANTDNTMDMFFKLESVAK